MNHVLLIGDVRVAPVVRQIDGEAAVSFDVVVESLSGKAVAVPVLWAHESVPGWLIEGAAVVVTGEVFRRFFVANGQRNSLVDVTALDVAKATPAKLKRVVNNHRERLVA